MAVTSIQGSIYQGYGSAASALGAAQHAVYRGAAGESNPTSGTPLFSVPATFTNAKLAGNNFERGYTWDDVALAGMFDASNCQIGDFLVNQTNGSIFFIIAMQPYLPIVCVQANRTAIVSRTISQLSTGEGGLASAGPTQFGGSDAYFGRERSDGNTASITTPCAMIASAGRATNRSDLPSASPGPSRWRIYLPMSSFPKGSIQDRDYIEDEEAHRHMVEAAGWTNQGYRIEAIRVEA